MIREKDVQAMEDIIVNHAGPVGKFVVKKAIADMGGNTVDFTPEMRSKLIELVLERAIFDNTKRDAVRKQILEAWNHG